MSSAMAAGRTRPVGAPSVGVAVPRSLNSTADGRRLILSRPYYAFRPRFALGLGLFVGYPVAFPYGYGYGGYYYDPYVYGYAPGYGYGYGYGYGAGYGYGSGYDSPYSSYGSSYARSGGLSFDITPSDAALFIDGKYVGTVADFSPTEAPLTLTAGRHRVDVRAQGYQTMSFDITVIAGQVIPYQGTMTVIR
jgi:hypothetical protein